MPYANKDPNENFVFFLKVLIFTLIIFYLLFGTYKIAFGFEGVGIDENEMGYYAMPYESSVGDGDSVEFEGNKGWYILDNAPPVQTSYYGDVYNGTIGNATLLDGHYLGSACDDGICVVQQTDDWNTWSSLMSQGDDFFIAIFNYHATCRTYFQTGAGSCPYNYGIYELKWGEEFNDINFEKPQGFQYGNAPIDLHIKGDYSIVSTTIYWSGIQVEMTYYPPFGTTTPSIYYEYIVFPNSQNEGIGTFDSDIDDIKWVAAIDGQYAYRARFYYEVYDYMYFSDWVYDEGLYYWIFSTGDYDLSTMPKMEDYFATTTDFGLLGNMFRDVLIYLFKPNESVLDFWRTIKDRVASKPPFGYYTLIKQAFDNLTSEATPAFALASATSTAQYIFTPLKNGLAWVLWILFGVWFLKRFIHFVV